MLKGVILPDLSGLWEMSTNANNPGLEFSIDSELKAQIEDFVNEHQSFIDSMLSTGSPLQCAKVNLLLTVVGRS